MSEWIEKTLGEVTDFISKGIPPKYAEVDSAHTIRVLNQKCNRNFRISYFESRLHDNRIKKVPDVKILRIYDVLINSTGAGTAGRVAQLWSVPEPTTIDGHMILMRPTKEVDPLYYGYAIKAFQSQIENLAEGSTGQTEINRTRLQEEVVIRYPVSVRTQQRIGRALRDIDDKILINEMINENLSQQARYLFRHWITKPQSDIYKLSDIADVNPETYSPRDNWSFVNYLDTSSITAGTISEVQYIQPPEDKLPSRARRILRNGDIVFSTVRPNQLHYGIISNPKSNMLGSTGFAVIRSKRPSIPNEIIYLAITEPSFVEQMQQLAEQSVSTFPSIRPIDLDACTIPDPQKEDRDTIESIKVIFNVIATNNEECQRLVELRDALLPRLMSGELDVSNL